ncbi:recombinase [Dysgonomonas sp. 216]|uniref:tyrosine-type recombinase/integrase n=1 Tax=Dysgonomonas sp. 216 TaxID=2302934 RepID=UPI0013D39835|nr:tyrosine-type recombinase/integrase [Dysgonomonas sp. 216]NDW17392.1 recombinase [Dysgonomonas sp. 216]
MTTLVQKYLSYLRYEKNYSLHTEISYSKDLAQFEEFLSENLEGVSLVDVDLDVVRRWMAYLIEEGVKPRSVNRKLSALKSFYRYLVKLGEVKVNPLKRLVGPKVAKPIPSFVSDGDLEGVLVDRTDDDEFEKLRDRLIVEVLYLTGMRRAELIGLKDVDVDFSMNQIRVTGKRNKQRLIPFGEGFANVLKEYVLMRDENVRDRTGYFFVRQNGNPLYPMLVYRIVTDVLGTIPTLAKTSPHVLRHSFATEMLNDGAELNAVKELLGHSSLASTEVYTHTSFEELKKNYKKAHPRA